jgi:excisionase family DNA binding protein
MISGGCMDKKILTVKEASTITKINTSVLYAVTQYEHLPHETIGGRIVIYEEALNEWMKNNQKRGGKKT